MNNHQNKLFDQLVNFPWEINEERLEKSHQLLEKRFW